MTMRIGLMLVAVLCVPDSADAAIVQLGDVESKPLRAHWLPAPNTNGARPAVIGLHGCGGLYRRDGKTFDARYTEYAERLHRAGYHVLLPDSFGSRGAGPICTISNRERSITVELRRRDALAALKWLAARPEVDTRRIALLGWSNGATTALAAVNSARAGHATPLAGAVVFYPGCKTALGAPFSIDAPLLMLLGEKDDWTPPADCVRLAEQTRTRQPSASFTVKTYADSYHGFDSARPVRFRADISNGINKSGVHQGGNPVAKAESQSELDAFLLRILGAAEAAK